MLITALRTAILMAAMLAGCLQAGTLELLKPEKRAAAPLRWTLSNCRRTGLHRQQTVPLRIRHLSGIR